MNVNNSDITTSSPRNSNDKMIASKNEGKQETIIKYYLIMFLFGIAVLTPTSTLLTALDYFIVRYPNYQPGFVISLALNAPLSIFMVFGLFFK